MKLSTLPLIILAAGKSTRMGFPKGLMPYRGQKLLQYQINQYFKLGGKKVIVVLGEHLETYQKNIPAIKNCEIIINDQIESGPFYSLQLALTLLQNTSAFFLIPMDSPSPNPSVWRKLARAHTTSFFISKPMLQEKGGHPIIIDKQFYNTLEKANPKSDEGRLDFQIHQLDKKYVNLVQVNDPTIQLNLNSPTTNQGPQRKPRKT